MARSDFEDSDPHRMAEKAAPTSLVISPRIRLEPARRSSCPKVFWSDGQREGSMLKRSQSPERARSKPSGARSSLPYGSRDGQAPRSVPTRVSEPEIAFSRRRTGSMQLDAAESTPIGHKLSAAVRNAPSRRRSSIKGAQLEEVEKSDRRPSVHLSPLPVSDLVEGERRRHSVETIDFGKEWVYDVSSFLRSVRLHKYIPVLAQKNMTLEELLKMDENSLEGLGVATAGARKRLYAAIAKYNTYKSDPQRRVSVFDIDLPVSPDMQTNAAQADDNYIRQRTISWCATFAPDSNDSDSSNTDLVPGPSETLTEEEDTVQFHLGSKIEYVGERLLEDLLSDGDQEQAKDNQGRRSSRPVGLDLRRCASSVQGNIPSPIGSPRITRHKSTGTSRAGTLSDEREEAGKGLGLLWGGLGHKALTLLGPN
eukprot:comp19616_c0_seq1/m.23129 comp19616_c0_seq1/g.23129  ORF comp19616_c0_seq1/g.23129 comp19616_c0_seq1/m.23129 type:complete len:424 (-) comp19616_c0_seq1:412-1683(-)